MFLLNKVNEMKLYFYHGRIHLARFEVETEAMVSELMNNWLFGCV